MSKRVLLAQPVLLMFYPGNCFGCFNGSHTSASIYRPNDQNSHVETNLVALLRATDKLDLIAIGLYLLLPNYIYKWYHKVGSFLVDIMLYLQGCI